MTYNEFAAKHPIFNLVLSWAVFAGMLYLVYITDGISSKWYSRLNFGLALLVITGIVLMLDSKRKATVVAYYDAQDKEQKKEKERKQTAWKNKTRAEKVRAIWFKCLLWVLLAVYAISGVWYFEFGRPNFACDETTVSAAQDLLNEGFPNFHGALKLSNPVAVETTENLIRCKADTNIDQVVYYNLKKQGDEILVIVNPIGDLLDEIDTEMQSFFNDLEYEFSID